MNTRYDKQQLDIKIAQGFTGTSTYEISTAKTQLTVKKLRGPIAIPMFTTAIE
jgi:hypothetical protein